MSPPGAFFAARERLPAAHGKRAAENQRESGDPKPRKPLIHRETREQRHVDRQHGGREEASVCDRSESQVVGEQQDEDEPADTCDEDDITPARACGHRPMPHEDRGKEDRGRTEAHQPDLDRAERTADRRTGAHEKAGPDDDRCREGDPGKGFVGHEI